MHIQDLLTPGRVVHGLAATSKKRLLEQMSAVLADSEPGLDAHAIFESLIERERLGSTGIGDGVALPHGRIAGLRRAMVAFATLARELNYDSIDQKPVRMVFALLVPVEAQQEHLEILRQVATLLRDPATRQRLLAAGDADELYRQLTAGPPT